MGILKPQKPVLDLTNALTTNLVFDDPMYLMSGDSQDIVNGVTGTLSGTPKPNWVYNPGPGLGNGLNFDGANGFISYAANAAYNITASAISIEIWKIWSSADGQMISRPHAIGAHTSPYFSYSIHSISTTSARMWLTTSGSPGGDHTTDGALSITNGALVHIVGTYDGTNMRIYQDSVLKDTHGITGTIVDYGTNLQYGANGGPGEFSKDNTFVARIWNNRTLSQSEISLLFANPFRIYLPRSIRKTVLRPRPFAPGTVRGRGIGSGIGGAF